MSTQVGWVGAALGFLAVALVVEGFFVADMLAR
jgi:hypothetical protein